MGIIGTQKPYVSLNEQYYLYNIIAEALNTTQMQEEMYTILSHSQSQEVEKNTYNSPCVEFKASFRYHHISQYMLQKVLLQYQRVDFYAYAIRVDIQ